MFIRLVTLCRKPTAEVMVKMSTMLPTGSTSDHCLYLCIDVIYDCFRKWMRQKTRLEHVYKEDSLHCNNNEAEEFSCHYSRTSRPTQTIIMQVSKQWVRSFSFPGSTPVCGGFFFPGRTWVFICTRSSS